MNESKMKKSTPKNKAKAAQGCMKISSFFAKQAASEKASKSPAKIKNLAPVVSEIVNLESEDEESESLLHFKSTTGRNKRKFAAEESDVNPPIKKGLKDLEGSTRLSCNGAKTLCNPTGNIRVTESAYECPSTSGITPTKCKSMLSVKTPEKLFPRATLQEHQDPDPHFAITKRQESTPDEYPSVNKNSSNKSGVNKASSSDKAQKSPRKIPKKLFERSPNNLNKFNVEVIRNFVKITPTKKEIDANDEHKVQRKSIEVQLENEKTPVKDSSTSYSSPLSKVRAKLDFDKICSKNINSSGTERKENFDTNNMNFSFEEDCWEIEQIDRLAYTLDLSMSHHCKVVNVSARASETIITVKSTQTKEEAVCSLQGFWVHSKLCIGDTLHIKATKSDDNWLIDNQVGFLVFEPDLLISTTSVVNSVFCKRRTVFKERFRGFDPTNKYMIVGSMVHSLIQDVLIKNLYQAADIKKSALEILQRKEWMKLIYESGEPLAFITEEFLSYIDKVHDFVVTYVQEAKKKTVSSAVSTFKKDPNSWKGSVTGIEDIEENIWCPSLGVKGKVDISIRSGDVLMPLEVKTGRASISLEHRGQVLLYLMMMNKLGYQVSSGLLLYLKEGVLKEIPPSAVEQRDIIILRNELAYFLSRPPNVVKTSEGTLLEPAEIPEPIDHPCCAKCPYNSICIAYSKYSNEDVSGKKALQQVDNKLSKFLTSVHIDYFMRWASLLSIEMPERNGTKELRDIYTLPPEERRNKGKCLINLMVTKVEDECNGTFLHTFRQAQKASSEQPNFLITGLQENSYIVVSVEHRPAVASGLVTNISLDSVTVSLDRNLNKKYEDEAFFLDSYDSTTFLTYNLASLALILDISDRGNQLRSIVIDKRPATFQSKLPKTLADKARPILKRLNKVQQRAVLKAIAANEYFLIKGMPGTGKTATIVALVQLLVELNRTVLITSHTHSAVDTVCIKLLKFGIKFMRLGNLAKMDPSVREYSEQNLIKDCNSRDAFEAVYNSVPILAVTCLGSGHPLLSKRTMDVCIVDESTQALQCSVFRPLHAAHKFILIGDPDQLPAVVKNRTAIELGMGESLFERLDSEESRISLNLNYRMNEPITALANALTYRGELEIGAERIARACLKIPGFDRVKRAYAAQSWLVKALDIEIENAVQFVDTGPVWNLPKSVSWATAKEFQSQEDQKCLNVFEAAVIYRLVRALTSEGRVSADQIGVIATYRIQVALLAQLLKAFNVDVKTVDQFQGKDKNLIIYSCSKSKDLSREWIANQFDLTEDKRRLNVAITRAKHKLIIVGDLATLRNYSTFKKIGDYLDKNIVKLVQFDDFTWDAVLDLKL